MTGDMESVKAEITRLIAECRSRWEDAAAKEKKARSVWDTWKSQPEIQAALEMQLIDKVETNFIWFDGTRWEEIRLATGGGWFIARQSSKGISFEHGLRQYGAETITEEEWWKALVRRLKPKEDKCEEKVLP